jgi:hypothetical protein
LVKDAKTDVVVDMEGFPKVFWGEGAAKVWYLILRCGARQNPIGVWSGSVNPQSDDRTNGSRIRCQACTIGHFLRLKNKGRTKHPSLRPNHTNFAPTGPEDAPILGRVFVGGEREGYTWAPVVICVIVFFVIRARKGFRTAAKVVFFIALAGFLSFLGIEANTAKSKSTIVEIENGNNSLRP